MPLVPYTLEHIETLLKVLNRDPARTGKILCLADPDIIADPGVLVSLFGESIRNVKTRDDAEEILGWHKGRTTTSKTVFETKAFFAALGYEMHAVDLVKARGSEVVADMNLPWHELGVGPYASVYDLVFDNISHQVFNIAQCWENALKATRVGGFILSVTPLCAPNNGFWNVSPTAYHDYFPANGASVILRETVVGFYDRKATMTLDNLTRCAGVPSDAVNVVVIRKEAETNRTYPVMSKFKKYPTSKRDVK